MSLSNPTTSQNPATKFIHFKGETGRWVYWDKQQEKEVEIKPPIYFIPIDDLSTIKGWSDKHKSGIYSNEVHYLNDEPLTVKSFDGDLFIQGLYEKIKYEIKAKGGKFAKSIYAMMFDQSGKKELVNFQFYGASLSPYMDLKYKRDSGVIIGIEKELLDAKNGDNEFKVPVLKKYNRKEDLIDAAIEMDRILQDYLEKYKSKKENDAVEKSESYEPTQDMREEYLAAQNQEQPPTPEPPADDDPNAELPF